MPEAGGGGGGGGGAHGTNIRTKNSSSKLNLNLSVKLSERCFSTDPAFVRNLFYNSYPSTLIDMLKHSIGLPKHCFKYLEFHSNYQTFNVGRAYNCKLVLYTSIHVHSNTSQLIIVYI